VSARAVASSRYFTHCLLGLWFGVIFVCIASLSIKHLAPLPVPVRLDRLALAMRSLRSADSGPLLVHVIDAECSCAEGLFAHLIARRRFPGTEEIMLFVGNNPEKQIAAEHAGFRFATLSAGELVARYRLEAAPLLVMLDSAGQLLYAGGYYRYPSALTPLDKEMFDQLNRGEKVQPLPIFGCAVSPRLQKALNPFGIT
jgi:hypothetical protein